MKNLLDTLIGTATPSDERSKAIKHLANYLRHGDAPHAWADQAMLDIDLRYVSPETIDKMAAAAIDVLIGETPGSITL